MATRMPRQYELLLGKARADIHIARAALDAHDSEIDDATVLFHVQQAVEKTLKALLAFNQVHFEKIHDLVTLVGLCSERGIKLPEYVSGFSVLNPFAVIGRYDTMGAHELPVEKWLGTATEFHESVCRTVSGTGDGLGQ